MRKAFILTALMMSLNMIPSYTYALGPNTVDSAAIIDGQVKTADIDTLAVTTDKIADGNITDSKLATNAVTTMKIADWSVNSAKIVDFSVTDSKLSIDAVTRAKIVDGAITDAKISGLISASKIQKPANVITVAQSGGDFTTISAALASLPDPNIIPVAIKVMPGTYAENITMKSNVHLQGAGRQITIIEINGGVAITLNNLTSVQISEFTIRDAGNVSGDTGISDIGSSPIIEGNIITGLSDGIDTYDGSSALIKDNIISGGVEGIYVENAFPKIINNTIKDIDNRGVFNWGSSSSLIEGNEFINNGYSAVTTRDDSVATITNNIMKGNLMGIYDRQNVPAASKVYGNTIIDSTWVGIYLSGGVSSIAHNQIYNSASSDIFIQSSAVPIINFNTFDTIQANTAWSGSFNAKSDGTPW